MIQVCQGDGLPGKICIKCVGLLSDCRPFVEKVLELTGNGKERSVSVEECFFCLSSENCLFPIPALSVSKTKNCFGIDVLVSSIFDVYDLVNYLLPGYFKLFNLIMHMN